MANQQSLLASVPLFEHLPAKSIADLGKTAVERHFAPGDTIVTAGEEGVAFFVIGEGTAEVLHTNGALPSTLHAGECFGEMALIDGRRRSATVRATTPLTCLALTRWDFMALVHSDNSLAVGLLEAMTRRVRELENQVPDTVA
jgi:CRP-like cAMP-binding protein